MTDSTVDSVLGATTGLLAVAVVANVTGKLLGKSKDKSLFGSDNHKTNGGKNKWW